MQVLATIALVIPCTVQDARIEELIRGLDADNPDERERAELSLMSAGDKAVPLLKAALPGSSFDRKVRIRRILTEIAFRSEEKRLKEAGLPARLARTVGRGLGDGSVDRGTSCHQPAIHLLSVLTSRESGLRGDLRCGDQSNLPSCGDLPSFWW